MNKKIIQIAGLLVSLLVLGLVVDYRYNTLGLFQGNLPV